MTPENGALLIEILLVEDDPHHAQLTLEIFKRGRLKNNLSVAADGEEAMAFLRRQGRYAAAPRPDLILLDLNLPRKDGRAVLAEIRSDPELKHIPVIVLTASEAGEDILKAFELSANGFVGKPFALAKFLEAVRSIEEFGLGIVKPLR